MKRSRVTQSLVCLLSITAMAHAESWPQWRGPQRSGVANSSPALAESWPKAGPKLLWRSEKIPTRGAGGFSSPVVADGRVFLFVNWKEPLPLVTRTLNEEKLKGLGWSPAKLPEALANAMEADRTSEERAALKGDALRLWIEKWTKDHLDPAQQKELGQYVQDRLKKGKDAIALDVLDKLAAIKDKEFANEAQIDQWFTDAAITGKLLEQIKKAIPTTYDIAKDVIVCMDANSGETLWKSSYPGRPSGWGSSSTPCIVGDRCYVAGDSTVYCLEAATGREIWKAPTSGKEICSSLVVVDGVAVVQAGGLTGLDANNGKVLWTQAGVTGDKASPAIWVNGGKTYLVCNSEKDVPNAKDAQNKKTVSCVDPKTGDVLWTVGGGGLSTPAVAGDRMVIFTDRKEAGLLGYRLSPANAELAWSAPLFDRGASPVIHNGFVYAMGGGGGAKFLCLNVESGAVAWEQKVENTEFSSPAIADGKIVAATYRGMLHLVKATPDAYMPLAKAGLKISDCVSPAVADGKVYLRVDEGIACFDLTADANPATQPAQ